MSRKKKLNLTRIALKQALAIVQALQENPDAVHNLAGAPFMGVDVLVRLKIIEVSQDNQAIVRGVK